MPILWPPDAKNWLIWKDLDTGKDWGQEEKGTTEDEMVGWHHQLMDMSPWVWVNSGSWWWTRRPGTLPSMGLQRVGHDWATELNWNENFKIYVNEIPSRWREVGILCEEWARSQMRKGKIGYFCVLYSFYFVFKGPSLLIVSPLLPVIGFPCV